MMPYLMYNLILIARSKKDIESLNPLPWCVIFLNCFGWALYGCFRKDYFIFFSNFPAVCLSLFYCISAIKLLSIRDLREDSYTIAMIESLLVCGSVLWGIITMVAGISLGPSQFEAAALLVGYSSCVCTVVYYGAPLSTIRKVCKNRNSASLFLPMILANLVNAILWTAYGIAIVDWVLVGPNALGIVFAVLQIIIKFFYWGFGVSDPVEGDKTETSSSPSGTCSSPDKSVSPSDILKPIESIDM